MTGDMTAAVAEERGTGEPLLKIRGLDKHFGPVQALYHVDLDLPSGKVTALCGDNGAGKSVLTKTIGGIYQPDHGQIFWEGHPVHIHNARDSAKLGIEIVYQDLALADNLDIVQNMFLGRERLRYGALLDEDNMERAAGEYQDLAQAYPTEKQGLLAQMAVGRIYLKRLSRPTDALRFYEAAQASPVPHPDWQATIDRGIAEAKKALLPMTAPVTPAS